MPGRRAAGAAAGAPRDALLRGRRTERASCASASIRTRSTSTAHEVELTAAERQWGVHFWEQCWRAGGDGDDAAPPPGGQLAERFGAPRAAGSRGRCGPTNPRRSADGSRYRPSFRCRRRRRSPPWRWRRPARTRRGGGRRSRACCRSAGSRIAYRERRHRARRRTGRDIVAAARRRARSERRTPSPPTRATTQLAIDAGHALDGRFRRGRSARHGAAHDADADAGRGRHRDLLVFGVRGRLPAADGARQLRRAARRASLHRRARVRCAGAPSNNTATSALGVQLGRSRRSAQLPDEMAPTDGAAAAVLERPRAGGGARPAAEAAPRRARPGGERGRAATERDAPRHEHRALAGELGLLPRRKWSASTGTGLDRRDRLGARAFHRRRCALRARCRRCAAGASRTACCR